MSSEKRSNGIQGHDNFPLQTFNLDGVAELFTEWLPGFQLNAAPNYSARASTNVIALQLNVMLHSGDHKPLRDAIADLMRDFKTFKDDVKTLRLAQLVNFLGEASDLKNLGPNSKTGGFVTWTSVKDPHLIKSNGNKQPKDLKEHYKKLDWDLIIGSDAGKAVKAINPTIVVNAKGIKTTKVDRALDNKGFFSQVDISEHKTFGSDQLKRQSSAFSSKYAKDENIKLQSDKVSIEQNGSDLGRAQIVDELAQTDIIDNDGCRA